MMMTTVCYKQTCKVWKHVRTLANKVQMLDKSKIMHIGHKFKTSYKMSDIGVDKLLEVFEKDLGVFVASDLMPVYQDNKVQSVLRMIKRNFRKIDKERTSAYCIKCRPLLEYCVQV